jgi:predicted DNA-binding WGR domain protein
MSNRTPLVNANVARQLQRAGKPWCIRLEYIGPNENNVGGRSSKYYEVRGDGNWTSTVRYGKIGSRGQTREWSFAKCMEKVHEKRMGGSKGNTPYRYAPGTATTMPQATAPKVTLTGPFALIAALVPNGGLFDAYDTNGNFIMKVTPVGAQAIEAALA